MSTPESGEERSGGVRSGKAYSGGAHTSEVHAAVVRRVAAERRGRIRRRRLRTAGLCALVMALFSLTLMSGRSFTPPGDVIRVILGHEIPGATFVVMRLRLPRAVLSVAAGFSFALAGAAYQTLLRNALASPDIIGISYGASAAAVVGIVFFGLRGASVSGLAVIAGIGAALVIYLLSRRYGAAGTRLILVGIGVSAILESVIAYTLSRAGEWNMREALRWLSGSVNAADRHQIIPPAIGLLVLGAPLLGQARNLEALRLGDDAAAALGVRAGRTRIIVMTAATGLIAVAAAATGPISFAAFLSGPIAVRITGRGGSPLVPAAITGGLLVLAADYCGQFLLPNRYPVGVVTGTLGAPYLLYLIVRVNRRGISS